MRPIFHLLPTLVLICSTPLSAAGQSDAAEGDAASSGGGPKVIYVVTDDQKLYAWEGNQLRKYEDYTSKAYGAEMPFTMFFTLDGKAIHGTTWATVRSFVHEYISEEVGSMGCVGLTRENAETMFRWAPMGTRIVVVEEEQDEEGAPRGI